jgi:hypothetical protein
VSADNLEELKATIEGVESQHEDKRNAASLAATPPHQAASTPGPT